MKTERACISQFAVIEMFGNRPCLHTTLNYVQAERHIKPTKYLNHRIR